MRSFLRQLLPSIVDRTARLDALRDRMPAYLFCALVAGAATSATAAVIHVPGDQPTIQAGINAAQTGDMVLVAPGTYTGPGNINCDVTKDIVIASEGGPAVTTIDIQSAGRAFHLHGDLPQSARVEGFTIRNGSTPNDGGGILVDEASPTIRNCVFTENHAASRGGGMAVLDMSFGAPLAKPTVEDCVFDANSSDGLLLLGSTSGTMFRRCSFTNNVGRGVVLDGPSFIGSSGVFEDCIFRSNTGGGVILDGPSFGAFVNCEITDHTTTEGGAGVLDSSDEGTLPFDGCLFARNHSQGLGGGAGIFGDGGAVFTNCQFEDNSAGSGGGLYFSRGTDPEPVRGCRFINNTASLNGGGLRFNHINPTRLSNNLFWGNSAGSAGGAIYMTRANSSTEVIASCTLVDNDAPSGAAVFIRDDHFNGSVLLDHLIIAFSTGGPAVSCEFDPAQAVCSDLFGNAGGDWVGCLSSQLGIDGNIALDPQFCNPPGGDFTLSAASPCAQAPCGLMGAYPVGCGVTAVTPSTTPSTWGSIKASFND